MALLYACHPLQTYERSHPPEGQEVQKSSSPYCKYNDMTLSLWVSCLFLTGIVGAFIGSYTNSRWGRRPTMVMGGISFTLGAVLMCTSTTTIQLTIGRLVMGLGVGFCVQTGPMFLAEVAPFHVRGLFNTLVRL